MEGLLVRSVVETGGLEVGALNVGGGDAGQSWFGRLHGSLLFGVFACSIDRRADGNRRAWGQRRYLARMLSPVVCRDWQLSTTRYVCHQGVGSNISSRAQSVNVMGEAGNGRMPSIYVWYI